MDNIIHHIDVFLGIHQHRVFLLLHTVGNTLHTAHHSHPHSMTWLQIFSTRDLFPLDDPMKEVVYQFNVIRSDIQI